MKQQLVPVLLLMALITACNKDKFTTEPQVKIKSISPNTVLAGDVISVKSSFTDEEGDIDSVYVVYKWFNGSTAILPFDTIRYSYASIGAPSNTRSGDINLSFNYHIQTPPSLPSVTRDTTAAFGILLIDKARHRSAYAESDKIRLKKI